MRNLLCVIAAFVVALAPIHSAETAVPAASAPRANDTFSFPGGPLSDFVDQLKRYFHVQARFENLNLPFRYSLIVPAIQAETTNYCAVLERYNELSRKKPSLGHWVCPFKDGPAQRVEYLRDGMPIGGEFVFEGGSLENFLSEIFLQYGVNLLQIGTVPDDMLESVRVPKMRLSSTKYTDVLDVYNDISRETGLSLGHWTIQGKSGQAEPVAVILTPSPNAAQNRDTLVRAFHFGFGPDAYAQLDDLITQMQSSGRFADPLTGTRPQIRVMLSFHQQASIIVVTGNRLGVELASEIIEAYRSPLGAKAEAATNSRDAK